MCENSERNTDEWSVSQFEWSPRQLRARRKRNPSAQDKGYYHEEEEASLPENRVNEIKPSRRANKSSKKDQEDEGSKRVGCVVGGCKNSCTGRYYRKYRVCQEHAKAAVITIQGKPVRFCQKCAKLEPLSSFDGEYRSCRVTLERHNERRRLRNAEKGKSVKSPKKKSSVKKRRIGANSDIVNIGEGQSEVIYPGIEICQPKVATESFDLNNFLPDDLQDGPGQNEISNKIGSEKSLRDIMINSVDYSFLASDPNMKDIYKGEDVEFHLSFKFQNGSPEDLPRTILDDIASVIPSISLIEGSIRPGCTYLSMTVRMSRGDYEDFTTATSIKDFAGSFFSKWRGLKILSKGFQVQMNNCSAQFTSDGSHVITRSSSLRIVSMSSNVVQSDFPAVIDLVGQNVDKSKLVAYCRQNGKYLTTTILADSDSEDEFIDYDSDSSNFTETSSLSSSSVSYQYSDISEDLGVRTDLHSMEQKITIKVLGLTPGLCEIEFMQDNILTESLPILVLPSSKSVEEAEAIVADYGHTAGCKDFIRDVGMVIRHVCGEEPLPEHAPMVQHLASRTISYCMEKRSIHLVSLLQMALPEDNGQCLCNQRRDRNDQGEMSSMPKTFNQKGKFEPCVHTMNYRLLNGLNKRVSELEMHTNDHDLKWKSILGQILIGVGLIFLAIVATGVDIKSSFSV